MTKMRREYLLVCLIFFYGLLSGCWGHDSQEITSQTSTFETTLSILNENGDNIEVSQQGNPIILSFSFRNISGEIQTLQFPDGQQYDLQLYNSQDTLVWNWANDMVFIQFQTELVFDVGEAKVFEEIWDQTSNEGTQVSVGIYNVYVNRFWHTDLSTGPKLIEIE